MTGTILFGIGTLVVLVGMGIWISIVIRRANRINHVSSSRLNNDLSQFASNPDFSKPEPGSTRVTAPIVFSDDLPTEVTAVADFALAETADGGLPAAVTPAPATTPVAPEPTAEPEPVAEPEPAPTSAAATPEPTSELEKRLAKLDDLHARGVITDGEHAAARLTALNE